MTIADLAQVLEKSGPWALLAIALVALAKLYTELQKEKDARIADAQAFALKFVDGQKEIATITANLGKVAETQEAERDERERAQRELAIEMRRSTPEAFQPVGPLRGPKR